MGKHESPPPIRMRVERGALVPTSAWDAERIDSYRSGSIVNVHVTQQKNRKLERKYWAILHRVVDQCPVKQRTAEDLHKALRLKLGVVDAYFSLSGQLRVEVKSTSTMDDPEYQRFYEDAMAELHKVTGVDPETLAANSADVGDDDEHASPDEGPSPASSGEQGSGVSPGSAADPSDAGNGVEAETGAIGADRGDAAASVSGLRAKKLEAIEKFLHAATDTTLPDAKDRQETVVFAKDAWKAALPDDLAFVKACFDTSIKVLKGQLQIAAAKRYLEGLV